MNTQGQGYVQRTWKGLFVALWVSCLFAKTVAGQAPTRYEDLLDKATRHGSVPIIVGLQLTKPFQAEGALSRAAGGDQRADIAAKQAQFREVMHLDARHAPRMFQSLPFVTLSATPSVIEQLRKSPLITSVEEDSVLEPSLGQSVPLIGANSSGEFAGWSGLLTGAGQTIAVLDTGVDLNHRFLRGRIVGEACFTSTNDFYPDGNHITTEADCNDVPGNDHSIATGSGGKCGDWIYECGHGTEVAGVALGHSYTEMAPIPPAFNGALFNGVAKDANLISVRIYSTSSGTCGHASCRPIYLYKSDLVRGLNYVSDLAQHDLAQDKPSLHIVAVNVSSNSYLERSRNFCNTGSPDPFDVGNEATKLAVDNLTLYNVATIVSSGNQRAGNPTPPPGIVEGLAYPACIDGVISVGSTTKTDVIADSTNRTPSTAQAQLSLLAPGTGMDPGPPLPNQGIYTSTPTYTTSVGQVITGDFRFDSGTSFAAPHVAGAWAILRQQSPDASVAEIKARLQTTGAPVIVPVLDNGVSTTVSLPRIRVGAAAQCATPIAPAPTSFPNDTVWVDDQIPTGGVPSNWSWDTSQKASGTQSSVDATSSGIHQHYFTGASQTLAVDSSDTLVAYVLLDPCNPPQTIMLQWLDGSWEHRAYWGTDLIHWGTPPTGSPNTTAHQYIGPLPISGQWARLEVPASAVGLGPSTLNGMAFTLYGGRAWFDHAGSLPVRPTAKFIANCTDKVCSFDARASTHTLSYKWNFGDGVVVEGPALSQVTHPFTAAAYQSYVVTLTAIGSNENTDASKYISLVPEQTNQSLRYFARQGACRLVDTRSSQPMAAGVPRDFQVTNAPLCGVPSNASAIALNIAVTNTSGDGHIVLWPQGTPTPTSSVINYGAGQTIANGTVVKLGTRGWVSAVAAVSSTDLILDVAGYFSTDSSPQPFYKGPFGYQTVTPPCRTADTRGYGFSGAYGPPSLAAGIGRDLPLAGQCGVPSGLGSGLGAVFQNLTVVNTQGAGYIVVDPKGVVTLTSNLNFIAGDVRNNGAFTATDVNGVATYVAGVSGTDLVVDASGYFSSVSNLLFSPVTPCRIMDTRAAGPSLETSTLRTMQVQQECGVPFGAKAVVLNIVVVSPASAGDVILYPSNLTYTPGVSTIHFEPGNTRAGWAVVELSASSNPAKLISDDVNIWTYTTGASIHLVADVMGYFK